jgi:hypothetical protein
MLSFLLGRDTALGPAIGNMSLRFGNAFTFGGLLVTLPDEAEFRTFEAAMVQK